MGTLGNVPLASAHRRCAAATLSCIQWKAHHKFLVPYAIIEYLQLQLQLSFGSFWAKHNHQNLIRLLGVLFPLLSKNVEIKQN